MSDSVSCDRCGKINLHKDGVHTCTPNQAWLTKENSEKDKSIQILANALKEAAENHSLNYGKYKELAEKYLND